MVLNLDSRVASQHRVEESSATTSAATTTSTSMQQKCALPGFDPAALPSDLGFAEFEEFERNRKALWETARALKMMPEELQFFYDHKYTVEMIPRNPVFRKDMIAFLKKSETAPAKWMMASGIFPGSEKSDTVDVRRKKLRALYKGALLFIRKAFKRHEEDPDRAERTVFWDPIAEVCRAMEIAPSALSRFCKELTGNSLVQVMDSVRAETLRGKLKAGVRRAVQSSKFKVQSLNGEESSAHGASLGTIEEGIWAVWDAIKAERKWPRFSQNAWANEMGFASYRRLYRACQVVYGMTPHQLELRLIEEVLGEGEEAVVDEKSGMTMAEVDAAIMAFEPYKMEGGVVVGRNGAD